MQGELTDQALIFKFKRHWPSAIGHQPSAIGHQPSAIGLRDKCSRLPISPQRILILKNRRHFKRLNKFKISDTFFGGGGVCSLCKLYFQSKIYKFEY